MTIVRVRTLVLGVLAAFLALAPASAAAQQPGSAAVIDSLRWQVHLLQRRVTDLEIGRDRQDERMARLSSRDYDHAHDVYYDFSGMVPFAIAVFCALWAQDTRRNPWLWFFLGLLFHVLTLLFLLAKNAGDRRARTTAERAMA